MPKEKTLKKKIPYRWIVLGIIVLVGSLFLWKESMSRSHQANPLLRVESKDELKREMIKKCGDIPSSKLNLPNGHYVAIDGPYWSPDCKHLSWSVWNSGTVVINEDGTGTGIKGQAQEGVFLFKIENEAITKLPLSNPYNNNPTLEGWRDADTLIIDYSTDDGRSPILFNIKLQTIQ